VQLIALGVLAVAAARADTPVLHDADLSAAVEGVSIDANVRAWELAPADISEVLVGSEPAILGADQPAQCATPGATNGTLRDLLGVAQKKGLQLQWDAVRERTAEAVGLLGCLVDPLDASLASDIFFLQGFAAAQAGDPLLANRAFARSLATSPGRGWDEKYPPDSQDVFESTKAAVAAAGKGSLHLGPGIDPAAVWVDGKPLTAAPGSVELLVGEHVVQVLRPAVKSFVVRVETDVPVVLAVPSELKAAWPKLFGDASGRAMAEAIVESKYGKDAKAFAWAGRRTYLLDGNWSPMSDAKRQTAGRREIGRTVVAVGATAAVLGGATGAYFYVQALDVAKTYDGETEESAAVRGRWLEQCNTAFATSFAVAGVGAAAAATGLALGIGPGGRSTAVAVLPSPGGAGLAVAGEF
jgi:hypothetical protein